MYPVLPNHSFSHTSYFFFLQSFAVLGEYKGSKHVKMQVEFKTGQTEALLTVIIMKECSGNIYPCALVLSAWWLQRPDIIGIICLRLLHKIEY